LPGVQSWVKGVANVRGRLLPLFDLAAFFGEKMGKQRKQRRVLILETSNVYSGLIVDQVFGMQHFQIDTYSADADGVKEQVKPFVAGSYRLDGHQWWVFNPMGLAEDARFVNAAQG